MQGKRRTRLTHIPGSSVTMKAFALVIQAAAAALLFGKIVSALPASRVFPICYFTKLPNQHFAVFEQENCLNASLSSKTSCLSNVPCSSYAKYR